MRIGIDCRFWNETGIGRYIRNVVYELAKIDTQNQYVLFVLEKDRLGIFLPKNFEMVTADVRWATLKEQIVMPYLYYKHSLDLLFIPNLNVPILYFKKFVVTIHDLTVLRIKTGRATTLPLHLYYLKRIGAQVVLFWALFFSKQIFCVSDFVKRDVMKSFNVPEDKIVLTPCAVDKEFKPIEQDVYKDVLKKYNINQPFIFYVGNAHPHKNLERLVESFKKVQEKMPDLTLVLGGKKDFFYQRLESEVKLNNPKLKIVFSGFIDEADLPAFYSASELYVNPSLHEGFGIQTLEAFACGTKVCSSNTTSLPEIGGNISYYFNPYDIDKMSESILACLVDNDLIRINEGFKRVQDFSWEDSAKKVYRTLKRFV